MRCAPRSASSGAARRGCCCRSCCICRASRPSCWNAARGRMCCAASAPGVLEWGSVELLRKAGVGARMDAEGFAHDGIQPCHAEPRLPHRFQGADRQAGHGLRPDRSDPRPLRGARQRWAATVSHEVEDVALHDLDGDAPVRHLPQRRHRTCRIDCDFVAGCDGFHGRQPQGDPGLDPARIRTGLSVRLAWRAVANAACQRRADLCQPRRAASRFARCATPICRATTSRRPVDDPLEKWTDDAFWDELRRRIPAEAAERLVTGPSIEKSIAPLRSFVAEPMRWGRLFLVGDAAHIVPPTGAKGLNLAFSDVHYL